MILRYQCIYVYKYYISPRVFFPFIHDNTPAPYFTRSEGVWVVF